MVDAIGIYTKYVSLDAEIPIGLPSDERRKIEGKSDIWHCYFIKNDTSF